MADRLDFGNWGDDMTDDLRHLFVGDETWPLPAGSLAALVDLGVPDETIAEYFSVETENVMALRHDYGLTERAR